MRPIGVITGAASGLGLGIADKHAADGMRLVLLDHNHAGIDRVAERIRASGGQAIAVHGDVADEDDFKRAIHCANDRFGGLHLLVNNAAAFDATEIGHDRDIVSMDVAVWDRTFAVNVRGAMLGCKYAVPIMQEMGGGSIINMGSRSAFLGDDKGAAYGSSKAAILALTRYVATMYGDDNIRCNTIVPASISGPTTTKPETFEKSLRKAERLLPHSPTIEDVADLVHFLTSDAAKSITGQSFVVDAGVLAHRPHHAVRKYLQN